MQVEKLSRRRTLVAGAAVGLLGAPFVRSAHAAGTLTIGLWDHWVPGANEVQTAIIKEWADKEKVEAQLKESEPLLKRVKDSLGERVSDVRVSLRLKDSAAVLVAGEHDLSAPLRRALEAAGQSAPPGKPVLELNVDHHVVKYLERRADAAQFDELALVLYEQAMLAEGAQLPDPGAFVQRLNRLWSRLE